MPALVSSLDDVADAISACVWERRDEMDEMDERVQPDMEVGCLKRADQHTHRVSSRYSWDCGAADGGESFPTYWFAHKIQLCSILGLTPSWSGSPDSFRTMRRLWAYDHNFFYRHRHSFHLTVFWVSSLRLPLVPRVRLKHTHSFPALQYNYIAVV